MSELQNRRYKDATPKETVKKLKKILKNMNIEVEEKWKNSSIGTYSLRVCVKGTNIGQNGKGMTKEFAMASGYAEFFERLQNNLLRFRTEKPTEDLPFRSSPDEKYLNIDELMQGNNSLLENLEELNNKKNTKKEKIEFIKELLNGKNYKENKKYLSIPYYSVKNEDVEYIPEELFSHLFGSNGMCAGNTKEEALIEGISEIIERYVATKILEEGAVLPEIPYDYINEFPNVKKMFDKLKENNKYYCRLVDCSFGGKYPAAALYIIEKNTGRFGFKLGVHPDYGIAMERCFTEAMQGREMR